MEERAVPQVDILEEPQERGGKTWKSIVSGAFWQELQDSRKFASGLPSVDFGIPSSQDQILAENNAARNLGFSDDRLSAAETAGPERVSEIERSAAPGSSNDYYVAEGTRLYQMGNLRESFNYFMRAAQGGDPRAQLQVGFCFEQGIGVQQDYRAAAGWYQASAEGGNAQAMKNIGQFLEYGVGVQEDWVKAAQWYERGARLGNPDAQAALARAYQFGVGVPQNRALALAWDKQAYANGNQDSMDWIRKLSNPMNNIGFRNDDERDLVMGTKLRTSGFLMGADPVGIAFRNSAERVAWLQQLRDTVDQDERGAAQYQRQLQWQRNYNQSPFVPNIWDKKSDTVSPFRPGQ